MKLAKTYEGATIMANFERGGRAWAQVKYTCPRCGGSGRYPSQVDNGMCFGCAGTGTVVDEVRVYTDEEFERMEKANARATEKRNEKYQQECKTRRERNNEWLLTRCGFQGPVAYAVLGNSFDVKEQLKEFGARYTPELHWVCPTEPTWLPKERYVAIKVSDVFYKEDNGVVVIRPTAQEMLEKMAPVEGKFVGTVGCSISVTARLEKTAYYEGRFGTSCIYVLKDAEGNTYVWRTASAELHDDMVYILTGTVKEHSEYNHVRQTVLTRCKYKEAE